MKNIFILGASGHAKVIIDALHCRNGVKKTYNNIFLLDDDLSLLGTNILGHEVLGKISDCEKFDNSDFVIAIGNNLIRKRIAKTYQLSYIKVIHPNAVIAQDVQIGDGTVVMAGAIVNSGTVIGNHCIVNTGVTVDHDNVLGDYVHLSPGSHLGGTVTLESGSWAGIGSIIKNNISICSDVTVGAGCVVVKNIIESGTYVGIPARKLEK